MIQSIKKLWDGFLKSLMILATGSLVAQAMVAGEQLLLTRIFSPEILGINAFLIAFPQACIGTLCGRYDLSIVYEEDESKVLPLVKLTFLLNLALSALISLGYAGYIFLLKEEYRQFLFLIPAIFVYLFGYGMTNTLNAYNNRNQQYKMITKMHMLRTFVQCAGTIGLVALVVLVLKVEDPRVQVSLLLLPFCLGMLCGVATQGKMIFSRWKELKAIKGNELWSVAMKHKKQPLVSAPAIFANGYSYSLVTMNMEELYGEASTGYYSMSNKLLGMPISLISGNISKVYMEQAAKEYNATGKYKNAFNKTFVFLIIMAIPMFLCIYFFAPPVCAWLFGGEDWRIAGEYIKTLTPMFACRFVATALSPGLFVCRKQGAEFAIQILLLSLTAVAGVVATMLCYNIEQYLWIVCIARSVALVVCILAVFYYSRGGGRKKESPGAEIISE
jgi:O-antigen/teichoic acid export membrane protein